VCLRICLKKYKKKNSNKNKLMRYRRKRQSKTEKTMECAFMLKRMGCAQGRKMRKANIHKTHRITKY